MHRSKNILIITYHSDSVKIKPEYKDQFRKFFDMDIGQLFKVQTRLEIESWGLEDNLLKHNIEFHYERHLNWPTDSLAVKVCVSQDRIDIMKKLLRDVQLCNFIERRANNGKSK